MTDQATRPVLITGAGGFIGRALATSLVASSITIKAGTRQQASGVPYAVPCDLDAATQVQGAVLGTRCVVHAAYGDVGAMARQCETLLAAMDKADVPSLIYLSSVAVYGHRSGLIHESEPPLGPLDAYAAAKIQCEIQVRQWSEKSGRSALIIRPGIVYGRDSPFWINKLAERINLGVWGTFAPLGEGTAALIHVDDLSAMIGAGIALLAPENPAAIAGVRTLHAVGPQTPAWNAYFEALATSLGAQPLATLSPATVQRRQAAAMLAKIWRRLGLPGGTSAALAPTQGEMALFSRKVSYSMAVASSLLGVTPQIGLAEGLARSFSHTKR